MTASIKVQQSRFALLKVEDDDEESAAKTSTQNVKNTQQLSGAKKKNKHKKKKPNATQSENEELKNLAFGLSSQHSHAHSSGQDRVASGHGGKGNKKNPQLATEQQWKDWKKADDQFTADVYEKDLQQALLQSKLEFEEKKKVDKDVRLSGALTNNDASLDARGEGKKKKNKDKAMTMSLEQFNQMETETKPKANVFLDDIDDIPSLSPAQPSTPKIETQPAAGDGRFFDNVENDVNKIIRKEKIQEEYQKQYAVESVMSSKYQQDLTKKDKEIEFLKATLKKQEEELKQVKKRNKQLCVILAQGEMKDKAEVLMQVTQLSEVRDELTEQMTELTAELEKERSKVHALKAELDKFKGAKHAGR